MPGEKVRHHTQTEGWGIPLRRQLTYQNKRKEKLDQNGSDTEWEDPL